MRGLQKLQALLAATPRRANSTAEAAALGLLQFIPRAQPRYQPPVHLAPLVADLEQAWSGSIRRTAHAPPRHAKTETVLAFAALTLAKQPHRTLAYVTYEDRTAKSKSRKARMLAQAAGVELAGDANNLNEWRTRQGGGLLATGVGGPLTGQGVDILLVDDPYKNRLQAESAAYRAMVTDWWGDVAETRIEPGGSVFVFHTRWHTDDLIGHLLGGDDAAAWQHIHMPALSPEGKPLWPERWTRELLEQKRRSAGEYTWASLFQGTPRPRGGAVFGDVHLVEKGLDPKAGYRVAIGLDLAYSAKTHSDYSVAVVLAEQGGRYIVLEVLRRQVRAPEFKASLKSLQKRYPLATTRFYGAGVELGTADLLADDGVQLDALQAVADKFIRAQPVAAAWNAGEVLVLEGAPWANEFVAEVTSFTGVKDPHDDQVDALAAAYDALAEPAADFNQEPGQYGERRSL